MMRAMVGERNEEGFAALTLESDARGGLVAVFVPEAGMICCSLRHRGEELLGQRNGLWGRRASSSPGARSTSTSPACR
jgi:hypothetical protein